MTSPTSAASNRPARGFTLIEMLVVIGILAALAGILLPTISRALRTAERTRAASDLQAISTALEAFKQDHGDYPRVTGVVAARRGYDGAIELCQQLIAPGNADDKDTDGKASAGFRRRSGGKLYGPYIQPSGFKVGPPPVKPGDPEITDETLFVILDRFEKPILYFPASPAKLNVRVTTGPLATPYIAASENSRYDVTDNGPFTTDPFGPFERQANDPDAVKRVHAMLGDVHGASAGSPPDGVIQADETEIDKPFLLWSCGPDEKFGPDADTAGDANIDDRDAALCDDVTNFR